VDAGQGSGIVGAWVVVVWVVFSGVFSFSVRW
jgi:hypothetical protein